MHVCFNAGRTKRAGFLIHLQNRQLIASFVRCQQIVPKRVNGKIARPVSLNRINSGKRKRSIAVNLKSRNAVVTSVGSVQKPSAGRKAQSGGKAIVPKISRKRGTILAYLVPSTRLFKYGNFGA